LTAPTPTRRQSFTAQPVIATAWLGVLEEPDAAVSGYRCARRSYRHHFP
jgi:hypothetical protein